MKLGLFLSVLFLVGVASAEVPLCYSEALGAARAKSDDTNTLINDNVDLETKESAIEWLENSSNELTEDEIRSAVRLASSPGVVVYNASFSGYGGTGASLFVMNRKDCSLVQEIFYYAE